MLPPLPVSGLSAASAPFPDAGASPSGAASLLLRFPAPPAAAPPRSATAVFFLSAAVAAVFDGAGAGAAEEEDEENDEDMRWRAAAAARRGGGAGGNANVDGTGGDGLLRMGMGRNERACGREGGGGGGGGCDYFLLEGGGMRRRSTDGTVVRRCGGLLWGPRVVHARAFGRRRLTVKPSRPAGRVSSLKQLVYTYSKKNLAWLHGDSQNQVRYQQKIGLKTKIHQQTTAACLGGHAFFEGVGRGGGGMTQSSCRSNTAVVSACTSGTTAAQANS